MAYFAKLGPGNVVLEVHRVVNDVIIDADGIEQEQIGVDFLNTTYKTNDIYKKTSYNTKGGKHYSSEDPNILSNTPEKAFRKNFAKPGYIYDQQRDAFMEPQPFSSWTLNEETCMWEPPVPYIYDGKAYVWNEETKTFDLRS
jgi:hypothetical protein